MSETIARERRLGDLVTSKKTGLPTIAKVVGIMYADYYKNGYKIPVLWDSLYPDWGDKKIIWVLFPTPQKVVTPEEYFNYWQQEVGITRAESDALYKFTIPVAQSATYPEDDLELVEE